MLNNVPPFGGFTRFDQSNALGAWMQGAGYRTMHVGRTLNGYGTDTPDITTVPPGWNDWLVPLEPTVYDYERWRMNENGQILELPGLERPTEFQTDYLGRRATELIERTAPTRAALLPVADLSRARTWAAPPPSRPATAACSPRCRCRLHPAFNEARRA